MQTTTSASVLGQRLAEVLPGVVPPAGLLMRLAEVLGPEPVLLASGDLRPLGFGSYDGQVCLVTPNRVVLATASGPSGLFGIEEWEREVGPVRLLLPSLPSLLTLPSPRAEL